MKNKYSTLMLLAFLVTSFDSQSRNIPPLPPTAGIYLYIPGVTTGKGSVANGHDDEVEILAFSFGFSKSGGPVNLQEYSITKYQDGSTNTIQALLVSGALTNGAELRVYKQLKSVIIVSRTEFKNIVISSYSSGGTGDELSSGCNDCPGFTENISFSFTGIKIDNFTHNFQ